LTTVFTKRCRATREVAGSEHSGASFEVATYQQWSSCFWKSDRTSTALTRTRAALEHYTRAVTRVRCLARRN